MNERLCIELHRLFRRQTLAEQICIQVGNAANGRFSTSPFTMAGVMCGNVRRSFLRRNVRIHDA